MDKDCVAMLKRMYGGEDGSTKENFMDYGDILANCRGCEENGKDVMVLKVGAALENFPARKWKKVLVPRTQK